MVTVNNRGTLDDITKKGKKGMKEKEVEQGRKREKRKGKHKKKKKTRVKHEW